MKFGTWYGKHWLDMWGGIDMAMVKNEWLNELRLFSAPRLKYGLECCKRNKFPPTLPEFISYCQDTPAHLLVEARPQLTHTPGRVTPPEEAKRRIQEMLASFVRKAQMPS